jgi:hypothetical protein
MHPLLAHGIDPQGICLGADRTFPRSGDRSQHQEICTWSTSACLLLLIAFFPLLIYPLIDLLENGIPMDDFSTRTRVGGIAARHVFDLSVPREFSELTTAQKGFHCSILQSIFFLLCFNLYCVLSFFLLPSSFLRLNNLLSPLLQSLLRSFFLLASFVLLAS